MAAFARCATSDHTALSLLAAQRTWERDLVAVFARCAASFHCFFFNDTATTEIYTLSLHDALPICAGVLRRNGALPLHASRSVTATAKMSVGRSEEHTSELQSRVDLVCRLLLE